MKKTYLWLLAASLLLTACELEIPNVPGMDSAVGKASQYYNRKMAARVINKESSVILARAHAKRFKVELPLVLGVITQESAFNVTAVSHAGAQGLMQLMPSTVHHINHRSPVKVSSAFNPQQNIAGGTWYLRSLYDQLKGFPEAQRWQLALASYNGGIGRVSAAVKRVSEKTGKPRHKVTFDDIKYSLPAETRNYVPAVLRHTQNYSKYLREKGMI